MSDDGSGGDGGRDEGGSRQGGGRGRGRGQQGRDQGQSTAERVTAVLSAVLTLALLGFVAWQAWTVPAAENPQARIVDATTLANGSVEVTVEFANDQDVGVTTATVEVGCGSPPQQVSFEHVPPAGRATAHVVCPPGTAEPNATVRTWQEP